MDNNDWNIMDLLILIHFIKMENFILHLHIKFV